MSENSPTILVTGASGFVGRKLVEMLVGQGHRVTATGRSAPLMLEPLARAVAVGSVGPATDWNSALEGCRTVLHLAAQVPLRGIPDAEFDRVNNLGTARLVEQAKAVGVTRFVHLSSVFAIAENAAAGPVSEMTTPAPTTAYGRSKLASEAHVSSVGGIILRPPVVYGPAARGNWALLQRLAGTGLPLPLSGVDNRRSLIGAENLASALSHLAGLPADKAFPGTYLIADGEPVSLRQILIALREGMNLPPRLFSVSPGLLRRALRGIGQQRIAKSMLDDLVIDSSLFFRTFGWRAPVSTLEGIREAARQAKAGVLR